MKISIKPKNQRRKNVKNRHCYRYIKKMWCNSDKLY